MKESNDKLATARMQKRYLYGPIEPDKVVFESAPRWAYDYLKTRDSDVFAALARADSEDQ